jgi:hypothetical protein
MKSNFKPKSRQMGSKEPLLASPRISQHESNVIKKIRNCYDEINMPWSDKVANFTNWARTRDLTRFLVREKLIKKILNIPGSIFECGVHWGGGVSSWLHLSEIYEPVAFTRRIFAFDTFKGFPKINKEDLSKVYLSNKGDFNIGKSEKEVIEILHQIENSRKVKNVNRLKIVKGDINKTLKHTLKSDNSISIALLYLDLDLYEPTITAIKNCLPRMPKGAIVVLDEYADVDWPGETKALMDSIGISNVALRCFPWCPRISYFEIQ